ncbi:MAG: bifunctional folylpolyglutamate synthase/dihydrofolate synthase [Polyangiaceae bacterium]|nr:bifunctional folylpolyglutamate synthase/dihydrofolate synthase [Polyangiaceae bacterium]
MSKVDHSELLRALYARGHRGIELGLGRVTAAAHTLGDPQATFSALHVAGTNGKGSTCAMLEGIARAGGLRVGLYTSPHLARLAERIRIDGEPVDDARLDHALARVLSDAPPELTFFETLTLAAFVVFHEAKLDVVVLEVGLGGRLDATNLVEAPLATGITSITVGEGGRDLEHEALLGSTTAAIAREKAGIAKRGRPLVVGPVRDDARDAIFEVARERGADPIWTCAGDARETATMPDGSVVRLAPKLAGPHQRANAEVAAAMATHAAPVLGLSKETIERGIANAAWPGRMEEIEVDGRRVILDCAHNIDGARALVEALAAQGHEPASSVLVFGALADKGFAPMLRVLAPLANRRVYTCPSGRAPASPDALSAVAQGEAEPEPARAIHRAIAMAERGETVLVCGSIYLVGAIRAELLGMPTDPVIAL